VEGPSVLSAYWMGGISESAGPRTTSTVGMESGARFGPGRGPSRTPRGLLQTVFGPPAVKKNHCGGGGDSGPNRAFAHTTAGTPPPVDVLDADHGHYRPMAGGGWIDWVRSHGVAPAGSSRRTSPRSSPTRATILVVSEGSRVKQRERDPEPVSGAWICNDGAGTLRRSD